MYKYKRISAVELDERIKLGESPRIIDVREVPEYEVARIEGVDLMPLSRFNDWVESITNDNEIVFMCHHGIRSAQVCQFLSQQGFENLCNLEGGIDSWSRDVDLKIPIY